MLVLVLRWAGLLSLPTVSPLLTVAPDSEGEERESVVEAHRTARTFQLHRWPARNRFYQLQDPNISINF